MQQEPKVVLRPKLGKIVLVSTAGLILLVFLIWVGLGGTTAAPFGYWAFTLVLSVGWLWLTVHRLHPAYYLQLDRRGFTVHGPIRSHFVPWNEVDHFYVTSIGKWPVSRVGFETHVPLEQGFLAYVRANLFNEGMLPDSFSMRAEDLVDLMNNWRRRYAHPTGRHGKAAE